MIDLKEARRIGTIRGLAEPQGVLYLPSGRLFVANETMDGARIFVNLPESHKVAVVDRKNMKVVANWRTGGEFPHGR